CRLLLVCDHISFHKERENTEEILKERSNRGCYQAEEQIDVKTIHQNDRSNEVVDHADC
ncbi:unnamed protein product, partial [Musa acuminata subsp. burmannicoides]